MFRKLWIRIRVMWLEYNLKKKGQWKITVPTLTAIAFVLKPEDLDNYSPRKNGMVLLETSYPNVAELIIDIQRVTAVIKTDDYIPLAVATRDTGFYATTLDSFLVTEKQRCVEPRRALAHLQSNILALNAILSEIQEEYRIQYYDRKLAPFYTNLFNLLEALLSAALA